MEVEGEAVPRLLDCVGTSRAGDIATASKQECGAMHEPWQASPAKAYGFE
jgi:hypothetical protein